MKLEIKKDMYVRNCYGRIAKIEYIEDNIAYCDNWLYQYYEERINFIQLNSKEDIEEIIKASFEITDLIRAGDYINEQKVYYDEELDFLYVQSFDSDGNFYQTSITKQSFIDNIETIVTKEQFEQMAYKVGENK
ncbi:MAG: hypothetical protein Q4C38_04560 [bacterium]|nr:hypothetical protein [bacterium]